MTPEQIAAFDLYEDVIAKLRFEPLTRAQQHEQLARIAAHERERCEKAVSDLAPLNLLLVATDPKASGYAQAIKNSVGAIVNIDADKYPGSPYGPKS